MFVAEYNREKAVAYARKWALSYNPAFFNFEDYGGDCTNFVSQCIYAGAGIMNFTDTFGWYYISSYDRTPSWTGVQFLYNFITANEGISVFADVVEFYEVQIGDFVQLNNEGVYHHSLLISEITDYDYENPLANIKVCAHTYPALDKPLSMYNFDEIRFLHILGARYP